MPRTTFLSLALAALALLAPFGVRAADTPPLPAATPAAAPAIIKETLQPEDLQPLLGQQVVSSGGDDMGRIVDVVVDRAGHIRAAVIDFGGFLGVGSRKVAVDWQALHFAPDEKGGRIVLTLERKEVQAAPEFKPGDPVAVIGAPASPAAAPGAAK
ncbi:MAG: PRC-barrel domain-containing protein [Dongiaceae bacterium]